MDERVRERDKYSKRKRERGERVPFKRVRFFPSSLYRLEPIKEYGTGCGRLKDRRMKKCAMLEPMELREDVVKVICTPAGKMLGFRQGLIY